MERALAPEVRQKLLFEKSVKSLKRTGFRVDCIHGSHVFLIHPDGGVTTVPVQARETIGPGLLRCILRDVEVSVEAFTQLLF